MKKSWEVGRQTAEEGRAATRGGFASGTGCRTRWVNWSDEISRSGDRSAGVASASASGMPSAPAGRPTNLPLDPRGWWFRVSSAAALTIEISLTMLASAEASAAASRAVIGVEDAPKEPSERISLTLPTLNRSDQVWFLANGEEKADAVERAIEGDLALPAAHVRGDEATFWFIDEAAAGGLPTPYICAL